MRALVPAALVLLGGLILWNGSRGKETSPAGVLRSARAEKEAMTGEWPAATPAPAPSAASPSGALESIEHLAMYEKIETLEKMFSAASDLGAVEKAALIDAAISLDDPQLIARAETLALEMLNNGSAADVLSVLPMIAQFPENSPIRTVPQESLCRFRGFGLEVVKLKYDRTFPNGRPWASVCGNS